MSYRSPKAMPIPGSDRIYRAPSSLRKITQLVKRMLAIVAALDSVEAMTLRDKRRILSAQSNAVHNESNGIAGQVLNYPRPQNKVQPDSQTERLAS